MLLAVTGASLVVRKPVEQYGGTGRRLECHERREAAPEAGSAGREAWPARGRYSSPAARFRGAVQESAIVSSIPGRLGVETGVAQ